MKTPKDSNNKKPKKSFEQSKNLVNASYLFVLAATLFAWNSQFQGRLSGFAIPSLLAILAFGFMWVHYLTAYLKANYEPDLDTARSSKITQSFVFAAIIAHPVFIISKLYQAGFGLPPGSFKTYFGVTSALFISLGTLSLLAFLAFEFRESFKNKPKVWQWVLRANDLAMLLIIIHGFKLGFVINSSSFKYVWMFYGLSLTYFYYDKYINKGLVKKFAELFIIALVLFAMLIINLATSTNKVGRVSPKQYPVTSSKY